MDIKLFSDPWRVIYNCGIWRNKSLGRKYRSRFYWHRLFRGGQFTAAKNRFWLLMHGS
jgi:hypothetical protein